MQCWKDYSFSELRYYMLAKYYVPFAWLVEQYGLEACLTGKLGLKTLVWCAMCQMARTTTSGIHITAARSYLQPGLTAFRLLTTNSIIFLVTMRLVMALWKEVYISVECG